MMSNLKSKSRDNNKNTRKPQNEEYDVTAAYNQNHAFIFIKPHANTPGTQALVSDLLVSQDVVIHDEGELTAEHIAKNQLIDQQ